MHAYYGVMTSRSVGHVDGIKDIWHTQLTASSTASSAVQAVSGCNLCRH